MSLSAAAAATVNPPPQAPPAPAAAKPLDLVAITPILPSRRRAPLTKRLAALTSRLRPRRSERLDVSVFDPGSSEAPRRLQAIPEVLDRPSSATPVPGVTSTATPAQGLRGARPAIGGWLRRGKAPSPSTVPHTAATDADRPAPWRPVPIASPAQDRTAGSPRTTFAIQLGIAFLAGLVLVFAITAVAAKISDGGIAVLEMGGLPIFIGGAASVVVFALLRSSATRQAAFGPRSSTTLVSVVGGLAGLVVAAGLIYQPAVAKRIQPRIERAFGVFGNEDEQAVKGMADDIGAWNEASGEYQQLLETSLREGVDFDQLRDAAGTAEATLEELVIQMRAHARLAQHPELRDGLDDLTSVYDDQLGGLRVVNRGLLLDAIDLIRTGDSRFKDAQRRARALFDDRLRSLLGRAGFDAEAFGQALEG